MAKRPSWTVYEEELIRDTINDQREAGKTDEQIISSLSKHMLHRNKRDIRQKFFELNNADNPTKGQLIGVSDDDIVRMIGQIDMTISRLEGLSEELNRLRDTEMEFNQLLAMINKVRAE